MSSPDFSAHRVGPEFAQPLALLAAETFPLACPPDLPPADIQAHVATALSPTAFSDYLADPARCVLALFESSRTSGHASDLAPIGYSMVVNAQTTEPEVLALLAGQRSLELSKFYTAAQCHGTGAASLLMSKTLELAAKMSLRREHMGDSDPEPRSIWLGVNAHNLRAKRFYLRSGFQVIGSRTYPVGSRSCEDLVMLRELP